MLLVYDSDHDTRTASRRETLTVMVVPTIYLDANLVIGIDRRDLANEQEALDCLLVAHAAGKIEARTSHVTLEEIRRKWRGHVRGMHEDAYNKLLKVPAADETVLLHLRPITSGPGPRGPLPVRDRDLGVLLSVLKDEDDARHIYQALKSRMDYFVTHDKSSILNRTRQVEAAFPTIRLRLPSQVAMELGL